MNRAAMALVLLLVMVVDSAAEPPRQGDLAVLYVGNPASPRGKAYTQLLESHFRRVEAAERKGFDPKQASGFDVVVLDWSQNERPEKPMSPLGPLASWGKPTVLLGSAGLLVAEVWKIHGTIG